MDQSSIYPTKWEIRYWIDDNMTEQPQRESFESPDKAKERRELVMAMGHPTYLRLFPINFKKLPK